MKIIAVVPVYNENPEKLAGVLDSLKNFVDQIVVVDDGSTTINSKFKIQNSKFSWLRHEINRGQGAALQTGTDYAVAHGAEIIIHFDADGQHNPADIPNLIKPLLENMADIVFGSRYLAKNKMLAIPWFKKSFIHPIAKIVNYLFTGLKLSDAHNGLRAFNASIAGQITLSQDRMAHATEYLELVKKNKIRYTEVAVSVNYSQYGQGLKAGIKIIKELLTGKML